MAVARKMVYFSCPRLQLHTRRLAMTKKPVAKKRAATKGRITVSGGIHAGRSEEHTSELQSRKHLVCRLLPETKHTNLSREQNLLLCFIKSSTSLVIVST